MGLGRRLWCGVVGVWLAAALGGCGAGLAAPAGSGEVGAGKVGAGEAEVVGLPGRFRIVPDDYHVPYAGTAEDGRKFFLSDELFSSGAAYVGLYLWKADGTFDEVKVDEVRRPDGVPPGQAVAAGADQLIAARLGELGKYVLEPIDVAPFAVQRNGVTFGWVGTEFEGDYSIHIEPGDFIAYYAPWDGLEYDT